MAIAKQKKQHHTAVLLVALVLIFADGVIWQQILSTGAAQTPIFHFLDVGQGDSELVVFAGGVKLLTDAGPDASVVTALEKVLPATDRYIDLALITHPQLDHFAGFAALLQHYRVGAFVINGRADDASVKQWPALLAEIRAERIPIVTLTGGDSISVGASTVSLLSPDAQDLQSGELNDTGLVELITAPPVRALFTADIGFNVENELVQKFDLHADILKVAHHGSKSSSSDAFLRAVDPKIAVIEVGAKNHYSQPSSDTLMRLASSTTAKLYRTDKNSTVTIGLSNDQQLTISAEK